MSFAESNHGTALETLPAKPRGRIALIRDIIVFQFKLALDGFRDLVMSPLSILAGALGVLLGGAQPDWAYRRLMGFGRVTDRWINLFDAYGDGPEQTGGGRTVDAIIEDIEDILKRDYAEGGVTARSRAAVETALDRLRAEAGRRSEL